MAGKKFYNQRILKSAVIFQAEKRMVNTGNTRASGQRIACVYNEFQEKIMGVLKRRGTGWGSRKNQERGKISQAFCDTKPGRKDIFPGKKLIGGIKFIA